MSRLYPPCRLIEKGKKRIGKYRIFSTDLLAIHKKRIGSGGNKFTMDRVLNDKEAPRLNVSSLN